MSAQLLSKLIAFTIKTLGIEYSSIHYYSDSTIALSWIKSHPSKWKTFVANRVSDIQSVSSPDQWHHVISAENPADICSRGLNPSEISIRDLWWSGPQCLNQSKINFKSYIDDKKALIECKKPKYSFLVTEPNILDTLIMKYSHFYKLIHILAYILTREVIEV